MSPNPIRRLLKSLWPQPALAPAQTENNLASRSNTQPKRWPYFDVIDIRSIKVDGDVVSLSQWREDAERSIAFSQAPKFLFANDALFSDSQDFFRKVVAGIYCGPYPRVTAIDCKDFGPIPALVESLDVSLLMIHPQNQLLHDRGAALLSLLRRLPDLRVQVYTGSIGVVDLFAGMPEVSRIEFHPLPLAPRDFHENIARIYGFEAPDWFREWGR